MRRSAWLGIGAGTLIAAVGLWAGLFVLQANRTTGLAIVAGGVVFAVYGIAAFSGVEDAWTTAFRAALYAMTVLIAVVMMFQAGAGPSYLVAAPVLAIGVGGAFVIPPVGDRFRLVGRIGAVGLVSVAAVSVYWVDHTVYALVAPLLPLPAVGLGDKIIVKGRRIIAEET